MLVLDINPNQLLFARRPKLLLRWLDAALALANSHLMLHPNNAVAAVAAHSQGCSFLYPAPASMEGEGAAGEAPILRQRDGQFEAFYRVESAIRREVTRILMEETGLTVQDQITKFSTNQISKLLGLSSRTLRFAQVRVQTT